MNELASAPNRRLLLAYAEASRDLAMPLARALAAAGFEVDQSVAASDESVLATARTVIVCWTPAAVASDSVTLIAARARKAGKLASVLLAPCTPPATLGGRSLIADLSNWRGDASDREFVRLVQAIHARQANRFLAAPFWRSPYVSWGGAGAAALAAVALIANFGDLKQAVEGVVNPSASEAALRATDAKVEEVLTLLKQKSSQPLSAEAESALRDSIERLLSAQSGARGRAADRLEKGDLAGASAELEAAAAEGEKAAAGLAETWQEIGALAYADDTYTALDAYRRAVELAPQNLVARTLLGSLYIRTGDLDKAYETFESVRIDTDDDAMMAQAYGSLGVIALTRGDLALAEQNFTYALEVNEALGNRLGQAHDLGDLGEIARIDGNHAEAEARFRRSQQLYAQVGNREGEAVSVARLGAVARDRRRFDEAERLFNQALALATEIADSEGKAFALSGLGDVALDRGRLDQANAHYQASFLAAQHVSARESTAVALVGLGNVAERQGDSIAAINHFREAKFNYDQMGLAADSKEMMERMLRLGATPSPEGPEN